MPLYEYKCKNCGEVVEKLAKSGSGESESCPSCGQKTLQMVMSACSIQMGTGSSEGKPSIANSCPTGTCPFAKD